MARWRVAQGKLQFTAEDLAELQRYARDGKVGPGDMIQPPGASEWLYASELPELKTHFRSAVDLDDGPRKSGFPTGVLIAVLVLAIGGAGYGVYHYAQTIPRASDLELLGEKGLKLEEMLVTASGGAPLRDQPTDSASGSVTAPKDSKVQLLAKRGPWYRIGYEGQEGWVAVDEVVPAYLFADAKTRTNYDPIYNPDRYLTVKNASWMQIPDQRKNNVTVFQFMLENLSRFPMENIKLLITVKGKGDVVLEKLEIPIEGQVPGNTSLMVGTLSPDPRNKQDVARLMTDAGFAELSKDNPDLALRYSAGIEVHTESMGLGNGNNIDDSDYPKATVDLLEVRAALDSKPGKQDGE